MAFILISHSVSYVRQFDFLNDQGGYYPETNGINNPWQFPIAFKKRPFYTNGSADLGGYRFDYSSWAMAVNNTSFLCSIGYDKEGDTTHRQIRVIAIGI